MVIGLNFVFISIIFCTLFSYILGPYINAIGNRFNIVDIPNSRKVHKKPIVRIGGLSIFITFYLYLLSTKLFLRVDNFDSDFLIKFYIFLFGGFLYFLLGIHDDIYKSSPFFRLFFQFLVAFFVSFNGINFNSLNLSSPFFGQINIDLFPLINYIITALWIVAITNAINWLDGIDGLAGGYCAILSVVICSLMLQQGNIIGIIFFSVIFGSIIGFLIRNFKPAYYIMGDCGSNFLGYCFSTSALLFLSDSSNGSIQIFNLFIIFSLPLGDMFFVIAGRLIKNQNIFLPDKNHIHHRLMNLNIKYSYIIFLLFLYAALTISFGIFNL